MQVQQMIIATTAATETTQQLKSAIATYKDRVDYLEIRVEQ
ncbi:MAG: hypothetical protein RLZZ381_3240, partial [Cyanobacteriota bacterium]